jgi:hypothetical protein
MILVIQYREIRAMANVPPVTGAMIINDFTIVVAPIAKASTTSSSKIPSIALLVGLQLHTGHWQTWGLCPNQELMKWVLCCGGGGRYGYFYNVDNVMEVSRDNELSKGDDEQ